MNKLIFPFIKELLVGILGSLGIMAIFWLVISLLHGFGIPNLLQLMAYLWLLTVAIIWGVTLTTYYLIFSRIEAMANVFDEDFAQAVEVYLNLRQAGFSHDAIGAIDQDIYQQAKNPYKMVLPS